MKILLLSRPFLPSIGGMEAVAEMLASQFVEAGNDVRVVTNTQGPDALQPYKVVRKPSPLALLSLVRWCDVCLQNGVSLRYGWSLALASQPSVISHQTWIPEFGERGGWPGLVKRGVVRRCLNVAISRAIAERLPVKSEVIPNPYDDSIFFEERETTRDRDLVFVGRLVGDKGADLLIQALYQLREQQRTASLTIIGDGPDKPSLQALVKRLKLENMVSFTGSMRGDKLRAALNAHKIMVVPSRWNEPFGIVALEGMACGCVVVGSEGGGLKEAIGPGGLTFPNGDAAALAECLERLLRDPAARKRLREGVDAHLARHRRKAVAQAYLGVLNKAVRGHSD